MIEASPPQRFAADLTDTFYHVIDLPNGITTRGQWDLRGRVDDYLGHVALRGKRVLEIGPASGFITAALEQAGATVTALEVPPSVTWDFVPFPGEVLDAARVRHADHMEKIRQSFWYTHQAFNLRARLVYADACNIPTALGAFDVALLGAVLLHASNPQRIVAECARVARTVIITEPLYADLERIGSGIVRLHPTRENREWHVWWHFSTGFFTQYLSVLGLTDQRVTFHQQRNARQDRLADFFTLVASRPE